MTGTFKAYLAFGFLLTATSVTCSVAQSNGGTGTSSTITVCVYNDARIPQRTLKQADKEVSRIFHKVGINLVWVNCRVKNGQIMSAGRRLLEPTDYVLQILRGFKNLNAALDLGTLGFASSGGRNVAVFYDRIEAEAIAGGFPEALLLGHVVAHEIAHLLLPPDCHSPSGLMQPKLSWQDWRQASQGNLLFSEQEGQLLRGVLLARHQLEFARTAPPR